MFLGNSTWNWKSKEEKVRILVSVTKRKKKKVVTYLLDKQKVAYLIPAIDTNYPLGLHQEEHIKLCHKLKIHLDKFITEVLYLCEKY